MNKAKNIQTFTIEKYSQSSTGIYEIDLAATIPEVFGRDVEIKLYKTTNATSNNITRTEGKTVVENNQYKKEDTITINGTPELIYEGVFTKSSQMILDQQEFDTNTLSKTTYYSLIQTACGLERTKRVSLLEVIMRGMEKLSKLNQMCLLGETFKSPMRFIVVMIINVI